jgi:hypothetical protein
MLILKINFKKKYYIFKVNLLYIFKHPRIKAGVLNGGVTFSSSACGR